MGVGGVSLATTDGADVNDTPQTPAEPADERMHEQEPEPKPVPEPVPDKPVHAQRGLTSKGRVRSTRSSAAWIGVIAAAILAIFLLIFIAQNSSAVAIKFLGFEGQISLAIAVLLAAVVGILVVAVPGSLRIAQLRRALRKNARG